jgi:hypothetical protein
MEIAYCDPVILLILFIALIILAVLPRPKSDRRRYRERYRERYRY